MQTSFYSCVEEMRLYSNEYKALNQAKLAALDEGNFVKCGEFAELQEIIFDEMMSLYTAACHLMHTRFMAGQISYEQRKVMKASIEAFFFA